MEMGRSERSSGRSNVSLNTKMKIGSDTKSIRESKMLIDGLGEFLLLLENDKNLRKLKSDRRIEDMQHKVEGQILEWLRDMHDSKWISLCSVVDASFVKTILAMGMSAKNDIKLKQSRSTLIMGEHIPQFQLLSRGTTRKNPNNSTQAPRYVVLSPTRRRIITLTVPSSLDHSFAVLLFVLLMGILWLASARLNMSTVPLP